MTYYAIKNGQIVAFASTRAEAALYARQAGHKDCRIVPAHLFKVYTP